MPVTLPPGVQEVDRIAAPGGGFYVLGSDGGVFAISGPDDKTPQFYGSMGMIQGNTLAGKQKFGKGGLTLNPTGGYTVTDTEGRAYGFDTNFAKNAGLNVPEAGNTLFTDPAIMAFIRASGQTVETAANQVRQQTAALNAARDTALGDIDFNAGETARKTAGSHESRGILRSSTHQQAQDVVERQRLAAQAAKQNETSTAIGNLNTNLVNTVLGQQQKAAELGLSTGQNQDWEAEQARIKKQYAPELAAGGLKL